MIKEDDTSIFYDLIKEAIDKWEIRTEPHGDLMLSNSTHAQMIAAPVEKHFDFHQKMFNELAENSKEFKFKPGKFVTVTVYGLNFPGRILECIWEPQAVIKYLVEYAREGHIETRRFYEDEIKEA